MGKRAAVLRYGLLASVSLNGVACVPTTVRHAPQVARVCDPKADTTCHPTANTNVVVK